MMMMTIMKTIMRKMTMIVEKEDDGSPGIDLGVGTNERKGTRFFGEMELWREGAKKTEVILAWLSTYFLF